ncbi:MAG TPA: response regulator transcription factor [Chitinophagaceae bacterium]|nr:response regulator transcription factor [Chitinophagaceae bacterium]
MDQHKKILLAEDEPALRNIIAESLSVRGFVITEAGSGPEALQLLQQEQFDLAVLDVMLPGQDGFAVVHELRRRHNQTPVIFLTSKTLPADVVKGFESGGNDYLKKPFAMEELVVRMQALLSPGRMIPPPAQALVSIGRYSFHPVKQLLMMGGETIELTARENEVLQLLVQHQHTLVHKQTLLNKIWGDDNFFNARTLDVFITRLRKYLKKDPHVQIINVRGVGYKLVW